MSLVSLYRCYTCPSNSWALIVYSLVFAASYSLSWSVSWSFLSFPQDTQKRYPYQGRLHLPFFRPHLMSFSRLFMKYVSVLFWFIARSVLFFYFACVHPKEEKKHPMGDYDEISILSHPSRLLPNTTEWLYAVFISVDQFLLQKYAFVFMPCVFSLS